MPPRFSWETGPFRLLTTPAAATLTGPDNGSAEFATHMTLIHNCWIRALNGLYLTAGKLTTKQYRAFLGYSSCVFAAIKQHHDEEESFVFPLFEQEIGVKDLMLSNVEQHAAFEKPFIAWGAYVSDLLSSHATDKFTPATFCKLIDDFASPLQLHLGDEIDTLLSLRKYPDRDIKALARKAHEEVLAHMKLVELRDNLPVVLLNHDATFEGGIHGRWPPMPGPMSFGIRRVATLFNAGYWQFTTCTSTQLPREYTFG